MTEAGVPPESRVYTLEEVATILAARGRPVPLRILRDCCQDGRLQAEKRALGWRVSEADLGRFLNDPQLLLPAREPLPATGAIAVPGGGSTTSRARQALAELKRKLEEERRRRRERLVESRWPEEEAPAEMAEDPVEVSESPESAPVSTPATGEEVRSVDAAAAESSTLPADSSAEMLSSEPEQEAETLEPCEFLAELEAESLLAAAELPSEAVEEREFPGRDLRMTCERARDEQGRVQRHGVYESWYGNGRQAARGCYEMGRLEGAWQQWHDNGRLHCVGAHLEGLPDGPWTWWDEQGRKIQEVHYDKGRPDGLWSQFHHNGRKWCEGRYRDGLALGAFRYWDSEGRPA